MCVLLKEIATQGLFMLWLPLSVTRDPELSNGNVQLRKG